MALRAQWLMERWRASSSAGPLLQTSHHRLNRSLRRPCGVTLAELMVVIAILGMMLAISIFAFIRGGQSQKERAVIASLETCIRQVRSSAVGSGAPAFVELIDQPTEGFPRAVPWVYRLAGLWHFETLDDEETPGSLGHIAFVKNCDLTPGRFGRAFAMLQRDKKEDKIYQGHVDCGVDKNFDLEYGGYLEAYIYGIDLAFRSGYTTASLQYVFLKDKSYSLAIVHGGILEGRVGAYAISAPDFKIPPRRWTKIGFAWDKQRARLMIDDGIVAVGEGMQAPINNNELLIGAPSASLIGLIDEPRIYAASVGRQVDLPKTTLTHNTSPWNGIFFAPSGALDIRYHTGPIVVQIDQEGRKREVQINLLGMIKRIDLVKETEDPEDRWGAIGSHDDQQNKTKAPPPRKELSLPPPEDAPPPNEKP